MRNERFQVIVMWDQDAGVYYVAETNVPGLNAEAETLDGLVEELRVLIPELIALNGAIEERDDDGIDVPWELVSRHQEKIRAAC